jgi:DNA repair exonuclease SbcCD ATPase subunit
MDFSAPLSKVPDYQIYKLRSDLRQARESLGKFVGKRDQLQEQIQAANDRIKTATEQIGLSDKVLRLLQLCSEYARQRVKGRLEEIVGKALTVAYGGNNQLIIDLQVRAGRPEVDYYLLSAGVKTRLVKPNYGRGGGKLDVISLAMRLAILELEATPGPLFLDEFGKHMDKDAAPNAAYFLKEYAKAFNRQIIINTHNNALAQVGDVSIHISRPNESGGSEVIQDD